MDQSPKEDLAAAVGVAPPDIEIGRDTARASAPIPTSGDELGALDADRCSGGEVRHGSLQGPVRSAVRARSAAFAHHGDRRRPPAAAERRPYSSQLRLATARAAGWTRRTVVVARTSDEASKIATAARLHATSLILEDAPIDRSGLGPTRRGRLAAKLADRVTLLKPRVMSLAVFTAMVGLLIAPVPIHPLAAVGAVLCIAAGAGAAGALNMWYDADIDAVMSRTAARPIPAGRVSPGAALRFGLTLAVLSVAALAWVANWLAAALLAFAIGFYVIVYTIWLKRTTPQNIVIGGAAGACPPLIGWAAATNSIGIEPLILALVIFFWTPPHFWALSLRRADDYARAGVPMLPVVAGAKKTRQQILIYSLILAPFGALPWLLGDAGPLYGIVSIAGGAALAALSLRLRRDIGDKAAMQLFGFSILYLFVLFTVLLLDVKLGPVVARLL